MKTTKYELPKTEADQLINSLGSVVAEKIMKCSKSDMGIGVDEDTRDILMHLYDYCEEAGAMTSYRCAIINLIWTAMFTADAHDGIGPINKGLLLCSLRDLNERIKVGDTLLTAKQVEEEAKDLLMTIAIAVEPAERKSKTNE